MASTQKNAMYAKCMWKTELWDPKCWIEEESIKTNLREVAKQLNSAQMKLSKPVLCRFCDWTGFRSDALNWH